MTDTARAGRSGRSLVPVGIVASGFLLATGVAHAQMVDEFFPGAIPGYQANLGASVVNRIETANDPAGVEVGDFIIRPSVSESVGYDSNLLGQPGTGSPSLNTGAAIKINSDWDRDAVGVSAGVGESQNFNLPIADTTTWGTAVGGTLALGNDALSAGYSHQTRNLSAEDLGVIGIVSPVPYSIDDVRVSYDKLFSRFSLTPSLEYESFSFGQSQGAETINFNGLDHQTEIGAITGEYAVSPGNAVIAILRGTTAQFKQVAGTASNNYNDVAGFLGLDYESGALVQYRALVGAESRTFTASNSAGVSTPVFELDALWEPTAVDTVTGIFSRELNDPASPFASNQTVTLAHMQLDHQLRDDLFIRGTAGYSKSVSPSDTDGVTALSETQINLGARLLWNVTRHLDATLSYGFSNGQSSGGDSASQPSNGGTSFTSHSIVLGISIFE
jgi:hypothetical protein